MAALLIQSPQIWADSNDGYTDHPDAILRIASTKGPDRTFSDGTFSLYLQSIRYIGELDAPFGKVHVAELFYIRSARRGTPLPARGHLYLTFYDENFKLRCTWWIDDSDKTLRTEGSKLISDDKELAEKPVIFDYKVPPTSGTVVYQGKVFEVPTWKSVSKPAK